MAEKIILPADLYDNALTEEKGDCTAKPRISGTLRNAEIADRIVKERTEYRKETIENILNLADQKKVEAIAEGKSLIDGVGQYLLNISGSFTGEQPAFDPSIHKTGITYTPGKLLLDKLKNISFSLQMATTGPVINSSTDSTSGKINSIITLGAPAIILGGTLLVKGKNPTIGAYFTSGTEGATPVKVDLIVTNTVSQIICSIPALEARQYTLSVSTQAASGYKTVKEPRTYRFPILLTVEGSDRPSEI